MKVELLSTNPSLISILENPNQIITLDANFLIPPDRSNNKVNKFDFKTFQSIWLIPILNAFSNLAIHEAVYEELIMASVKSFANQMINSTPPKLVIHKDALLTPTEMSIRNTVESIIAPLTKYDPALDNKADKGEVKSLSYIAAKELIYFAANDYNAIQLVEKAKEWSTQLDNVQVIKLYEVIFYLYVKGLSPAKSLRMLYRYLYYLTNKEKNENPSWGDFTTKMQELYYEFTAT